MAIKKERVPHNSARGEVLVAILNNKADFARLQEQGWYRIPKASAPRRWPPQWLAFYQTKIFQREAFAINYYGRVRMIRTVSRRELFPDEPPNEKSDREYYQIFLHGLVRREPPILSRKLRRIVFIPTTWRKFLAAAEINDLFDDSPLEDLLWAELKRLDIAAERQMDLKIGDLRYLLDFALYCIQGRIDIEADGDTWHADRERIPEDNHRNNALATQGWHVLRFNGDQIRDKMADYCIPQITDSINRLGGLSEEGRITFYTSPGGIIKQLTLFDKRAEYKTNPES